MTETPNSSEQFTLKITPGQELEGFDAEIADAEGCEPYNLATIKIKPSLFQAVFDDRRPGEMEKHVGFGNRLVAAANHRDDAVELLEELEEYFDQRADAEYFTDSPRPIANEEMGHLVKIRALLHSITTRSEQGGE